MKPLTDKGIEVVGVSGDSAKTHEQFKKHNKLTFTLLADEKGEVAKRFGVPTKPGGDITVQVDGQPLKITQGVRAARWTFVIGKDGTILYKDMKASTADDGKKILEFIEKKAK